MILLDKIIIANDKLFLQLALLEEANLSKVNRQNLRVEKLYQKMILWINRIIYEDYYRMNEVEKHCGVSWRNIVRYSKKGYIERVKIGNEIRISAEQAQKALFILNCKKILTIPNKTALKIYENKAERLYCEAKISKKLCSYH